MVTLNLTVRQSEDGGVEISREVVSSDGTEVESYYITHVVSVIDALMDASGVMAEEIEEDYGESMEALFRRN